MCERRGGLRCRTDHQFERAQRQMSAPTEERTPIFTILKSPLLRRIRGRWTVLGTACWTDFLVRSTPLQNACFESCLCIQYSQPYYAASPSDRPPPIIIIISFARALSLVISRARARSVSLSPFLSLPLFLSAIVFRVCAESRCSVM